MPWAHLAVKCLGEGGASDTLKLMERWNNTPAPTKMWVVLLFTRFIHPRCKISSINSTTVFGR